MTTNYGNATPAEAPISRPLPGAHLADPAPLGLAAFALTTFLLSVVNAGWMDSADEGYVLGIALAYGGIAQFAAGMWEFAKGNTFGALAFSSFGAFWVSFWWLVEHDAGNLADADKAIGWYLFAWGVFTLYMTVAASRVSLAVLGVFVLLTITFFLLAWGKWATSEGITHIGGYFGLATAVVAWYTSFAGVTTFTYKRQLLPVFPRL
jgi:succinate-acetate transporter protein